MSQVYVDTFGDGLVAETLAAYGNDWVVDATAGGTPTVANSLLSVGTQQGATIVRNTTATIASGRICCSLLWDSGVGLGVSYRAADATHFYLWDITNIGNAVSASFAVANGGSPNNGGTNYGGPAYTAGTACDVDITFAGGTHTLAVNGVAVATATDSTFAAAGGYGFRNGFPGSGNRTALNYSVSDNPAFNPGALSIPGSIAGAVALHLGPFGVTVPATVQFQRAPDASGSPGTFANLGSPVVSSTRSATYSDGSAAGSTTYWYRAIITDSATPTPFTATVGPKKTTTTASSIQVSFSPSTLSIPQGGSATTTMTAVVSDGTDPVVAPNFGGLPDGVTVTYDPPTFLAGASSVATFQASSTAAIGNSPLVLATTTPTGSGLSPNGSLAILPAAITFGSASAGTIPSAGDVRYGTAVGSGTGTLRVPTANQVLAGVAVDAGTGTVTLPGAADVRLGTTYGPGLSLDGTLVVTPSGSGTTGTIPSAGDVRYGTAVGSSTGTLKVPSAAQVLAQVPVDATVGTVVLPSAGQVELGVVFGPSSGSTGTYVGAGGSTASGSGATIEEIADLLGRGVVLAADGWDSVMIEPGINARQALSPIAAFLGGIMTGAAGGNSTIVIRAMGAAANGPARITAVTDQYGNRPTMTLNLPE